MKEIDDIATSKLLAILDNDINLKCEELKEQQKQIKLKKIFFSSCIFIFLSFMVQIFFKILSFNFLTVIILYQVVVLVTAVPFISNFNKGILVK